MDAPEFDFYDHMDGIWKRNLEWRHFGDAYQHLRTSNTIVQINKHTSSRDGRRFLTWSFGLDLVQSSMKFGYVMKLEPLVCRHSSLLCVCASGFASDVFVLTILLRLCWFEDGRSWL